MDSAGLDHKHREAETRDEAGEARRFTALPLLPEPLQAVVRPQQGQHTDLDDAQAVGMNPLAFPLPLPPWVAPC